MTRQPGPRGAAALKRAQTHCKHGHELAGDNLGFKVWKQYTGRYCKTCLAIRGAARLLKRAPLPEEMRRPRFIPTPNQTLVERGFCKHGHDISAVGVRINTRGSAECRECLRTTRLKYRNANLEQQRAANRDRAARRRKALRENGELRSGYVRRVIERFSDADVAMIISAAQSTGRAINPIDGASRWSVKAFLQFSPDVRRRVEVAKQAFVRSPAGLTGQIAAQPHDVFTAIDRALPRSIPDQIRQEAMSEMMLAVLEGNITLIEACARSREFISASYKMFPTSFAKFGSARLLSLDETVFEDGSATRSDFVSQGLWQ